MNTDMATPMLDMGEYLKKYVHGTGLHRHIWEDHGGDSFEFFKNILPEKLGPHDTVGFSGSLLDIDMSVLLRKYGPALVSGFKVTRDFSSRSLVHVGEPEPECLGRHAMVLIGCRVDDRGKRRYLLQNWWKSKPYVELDDDHFASSCSTIHFIKKKQFTMGNFPTSLEEYVECEQGLDASETFTLEA
jgi:hypothetical protein